MNRINKIVYLFKIARESDSFYNEAINKIIGLIKNKSVKVESNNPSAIHYRIDLRDLDIEYYKFFHPRTFGDYLDIIFYEPSKGFKREEEGEYKRMPGNPSPEISIAIRPHIWKDIKDEENIFEALVKKYDWLLAHEISHFLDDTRFSNVKTFNAASRYGKENTGMGSFGYINSTEELQARIMQVIFFIKKELFNQGDFKNLYESYRQKWLPIYEKGSKNEKEKKYFIAKLMYHVANNDLNQFVNHILNNSDYLYIGDKDLLEKTRKRYMGRFYDLFIELRDRLEGKDEEMDEDKSFSYPDEYFEQYSGSEE